MAEVSVVCTASCLYLAAYYLIRSTTARARYEDGVRRGSAAATRLINQNRAASCKTNCINIRLIRPTPCQLEPPNSRREGCMLLLLLHGMCKVIVSIGDGARKVCEPPDVRAMVLPFETQRWSCTCIGLVDQFSRAIPPRQHAVEINSEPDSTRPFVCNTEWETEDTIYSGVVPESLGWSGMGGTAAI